jgi:hypothetical protein
MERMKLRDRMNFMRLYIRPALEAGIIELANPGSPRSANQKYRLVQRPEAAL